MTEKAATQQVHTFAAGASAKDRVLTWLDFNLAVLFNVPTVVLLAGLVAFPTVLVIWTSLTDWQLVMNQEPNFVGLSNYVTMWQEER